MAALVPYFGIMTIFTVIALASFFTLRAAKII